MQDAYSELVKLAVERRARLEESRKLWQFYWDMADEENWIKEKEQIVSTTEIGHDLTTINLLLSKHKVFTKQIIIFFTIDNEAKVFLKKTNKSEILYRIYS